MTRICSVEDCGKAFYSKGFCRPHYSRWAYRGGDPATNMHDKGGIRKHRMYPAWAAMLNRCNNQNHSSYPRYGGAGITVCERWRDFRNFLADMGERPEGKTLDRIDGKKGYEPANCRWATAAEQRQNITPEGDKKAREAMSRGVKAHWAKWRAGAAPRKKRVV